MPQFLTSEPAIRFMVFAAVFSSMAILELVSPRLARPEMAGSLKMRRWFTNLSMVVLSTILMRVVFPAAAVGTAIFAERHGHGLLRAAQVPPFIGGVFAFVFLDFAVWLEHLASHKIPLLWRIHRMHHADQGFDLTTALRFHPVEILLSMVWKAAIILALGPPVIAVLVFEIVLNATAMFNHANFKIPLPLDRRLRLFIVTPDMHRVHHSTIQQETDSNYGFNLPLWDRMFGTYRDQPRDGHEAMKIGLDEFRGGSAAGLGWSLLLPFRPSGYEDRPQHGAQKTPSGK
ncbi:MAG: sterol desaturase family protein [Notoacmeibacter sp.]|nr:sterol desaturase family protein [Notoacmeibacter sp.]